MAFEKKWAVVPPQFFTSNGTTDGKLTVSLSYLFKVGQKVILGSNTVDKKEYKINRIPDATTVEIGSIGKSVHDRADISAYTTGDNATIQSEEQNRTSIPPDDVWRGVFEEEPTVALRSMLVGLSGDPIDDANPLPITGDISVSVGDGVQTPNILNISIPAKNVETAIPLPNGTKILRFHARKDSKLQYSFTSGATDTTYKTLWPGNEFRENGIQLSSKVLYVRTSKDDEIIEVLAWT